MRLLVVELEPTHYKIDLWNAVEKVPEVLACVLFTERRNWQADAGHIYDEFPETNFYSRCYLGKGMGGVIASALGVAITLLRGRWDLVYIAGYVHVQTLLAIFICVISGKKFVVHADQFNNGLPQGKFKAIRAVMRDVVRALIFRKAAGILVCGKVGVRSCVEAGCGSASVYNFPYVVSADRIHKDASDPMLPSSLGSLSLESPSNQLVKIFFSGRMIERKGLVTLLEALSSISMETLRWVLWIEGDGPLLDYYKKYSANLPNAGRFKFLGFCQHKKHSWLIQNCDIVVVPSTEDSWGIVVDEGMQLGKLVISTTGTGSALDRITDHVDGFIVRPLDAVQLADRLSMAIECPELRRKIGGEARVSTKIIRPVDNADLLVQIASNSNSAVS